MALPFVLVEFRLVAALRAAVILLAGDGSAGGFCYFTIGLASCSSVFSHQLIRPLLLCLRLRSWSRPCLARQREASQRACLSRNVGGLQRYPYCSLPTGSRVCDHGVRFSRLRYRLVFDGLLLLIRKFSRDERLSRLCGERSGVRGRAACGIDHISPHGCRRSLQSVVVARWGATSSVLLPKAQAHL
jgi:hypothetical protein